MDIRCGIRILRGLWPFAGCSWRMLWNRRIIPIILRVPIVRVLIPVIWCLASDRRSHPIGAMTVSDRATAANPRRRAGRAEGLHHTCHHWRPLNRPCCCNVRVLSRGGLLLGHNLIKLMTLRAFDLRTRPMGQYCRYCWCCFPWQPYDAILPTLALRCPMCDDAGGSRSGGSWDMLHQVPHESIRCH